LGEKRGGGKIDFRGEFEGKNTLRGWKKWKKIKRGGIMVNSVGTRTGENYEKAREGGKKEVKDIKEKRRLEDKRGQTREKRSTSAKEWLWGTRSEGERENLKGGQTGEEKRKR